MGQSKNLLKKMQTKPFVKRQSFVQKHMVTFLYYNKQKLVYKKILG